MSKTREERRRIRRDILTGFAWLALCVAIVCAAHCITEYVIVDTPMGIYAEEADT